MDPITIGALITGGSSLLGSIFSSDTSAQNVDKQLQFAQGQQQWQEKMSNTAYQRASADMKAAGLNPAMMFGGGGAASTPGQIAAPNFSAKTHPLAGVGDAVSRGVGAMVTAKTVDKMSTEIANLEAENARIKATTKLLGAEEQRTSAQTGLTRQQTQTEWYRTDQQLAEARLAHLGIPVKRLTATEAEGILELPESVLRNAAKIAYGVGKAGDIAGTFISSAKGIKSLLPQRSTTHRSNNTGFDEFWENRSGMWR